MNTILTDPKVQKAADAVAAASVPANLAIWLGNIDMILRICVSTGSLVLIGFAIWAKVKGIKEGS